MVRFDRTIPPGGEGAITLKINTRGLHGPINKTARVYTNDPKKRLVTLAIKGFVKVAILVSPSYVSLRGYEGSVASRFITITAMEKRPLKLEPAGFNLSERVTYRIEVIEPGKKFRVYFKNRPTPAGTFQGTLILRTNYPEKSQISIPISAKFRKQPASANTRKAGKTTPKDP